MGPSSWISNQEPWTPSELDHSVNSSDQTTSFSDKLVPVTTGPRVTTPKVLSSSTPSSTLSERKLRVAIASKVSRSPTLSVVVPDPVWEPSSSPRSEKSTQTESWPLSPSCHHQRYLIPLLSHITPPFPCISSSRTPMRLCALITRPFMISASEPSSSPPQPMVILTIWSLLLSPVSPAASDSQVSSTPILESSLSTSSHSHVSTSSCKDSPHSPPEDPSSTEPSPSQSSPNKCSMPRTCALLTQ